MNITISITVDNTVFNYILNKHELSKFTFKANITYKRLIWIFVSI